MGTRQQIIDFILEQMSGVRDASARKMFGEFAIYSAGKVVALVCDDQLFVKPTEAGKQFIGAVTMGEPYPGAKPWFLVDGDQWEDGDWLSELIRLTANALPMPKTKTKTKAVSKTKAPSKPKAKPKAPSKPKAKTKAPSKPKAKTKAPSKPKAKTKAPSKPKAKTKLRAKRTARPARDS